MHVQRTQPHLRHLRHLEVRGAEGGLPAEVGAQPLHHGGQSAGDTRAASRQCGTTSGQWGNCDLEPWPAAWMYAAPLLNTGV